MRWTWECLSHAWYAKLLRTYYSSKEISDNNLAIKLFLRSQTDLENNAKKILKKIPKSVIAKLNIDYKPSFVEAGSGSLPTEKISSISLSLYSKTIASNQIQKKFLNLNTPLIGYIKDDVFHIDLKAIPDNQIDILIESIKQIDVWMKQL